MRRQKLLAPAIVIGIACLLMAACGPIALPTPTTPPATAVPTLAPPTLPATAVPTRVPPTLAATAAPTLVPPTPTSAPPVAGVSQPADGKYLFVELADVTDGTGKLPALAIDFPMYRFDPASGILRPFAAYQVAKFSLSATDWGFIGSISVRRGAAGTGGAGDLVRIGSLPASAGIFIVPGVKSDGNLDGRAAPVRLTAVSPEGTLEVTIDGERAVLAAGQQWSHSMTFDVATDKYKGQYMVTTTLRNYGWQERAKIQTAP